MACDISHEFIRRNHLYFHDRLEQHRPRPSGAFLNRLRTGNLESHFRGVNVVIGTENQINGNIRERETGDDSPFQTFADTFLNRRNKLLRNNAALDGIDKLKVLFASNILRNFSAFHNRRKRFDFELGVTVLSAASRLLDVFGFRFRFNRYGLTVRHLRLADGRFDVKFSLHAINHDLKLKLTHALDESLAGFLIGFYLESRVFVRKPFKRVSHLLLIGFSLGLDAHGDNRLREFYRFENDRIVFVAKSMRSLGVFKTDSRGDLAGKNLFYLLAFVRLQPHNTGQPLAVARRRVVNI